MNNNLNNLRSEQSRAANARRARARKRRRTDIRCVAICAAVLFGVSIVNIFQFNRPTESEVEKRRLAEFPKFSLSSLASGEFTEGINSFFADTFIGRDKIVSLSKKLDTLRGFDYSVGNGNFVILNQGSSASTDTSDIGDRIDSLFSSNATESPSTSAPDDTNDEPDDAPLTISKSQLTLTAGSGAMLTAETDGDGEVLWESSDKSVLTVEASGNTANIKALSAGSADVVCTYGERSVVCSVKVEEISTGGVDVGGTADFMTNGLFIYGDAVYTQCWYLPENVKNFARVAAYYKKLFPDTRVNVCIIPTSAIMIDNEEIKSQLTDQEAVFDAMSSIMNDSETLGGEKINFVNTYDEMYAKRGEYIYFKSDHHWTQRGAYYAYKAFVESVGLEAASLDSFDIKILTDSYSGSMYDYTQDERVKSFKDTVEAFMTRKNLTMTVTDRSGTTQSYSEAIMTWSKSYSAFLCGDNPYTVINVPENPQDRNILVLKDSYGNALVPFLAENYGNIIVVDTRYTQMNVYEMFSDYDLTDILFINNLEAANSPAWTDMYLRAVGAN